MKKKIISLLLALTMVLPLVPVFEMPVFAETAEFAGGSGTEADPYLIATKEHLNNVRNHLDAHYKMVADIVFAEADFEEGGNFYNNGSGWEPLGSSSENAFYGCFDGDGYTVSGIQIVLELDETAYAGLFGFSCGEIKNTNIERSTLTIVDNSPFQYSGTDIAHVGHIVGVSNLIYGSVTNCNSDGIINIEIESKRRDSSFEVGGIVGTGNAINCTSAGKINVSSSNSEHYSSSRISVGGISGYAYDVISCSNTCNISATISYDNKASASYSIGGICGYGENISQCNNAAAIYAKSDRYYEINIDIGGIAGRATTVKQSFNSGKISGIGGEDVCTGGIAGFALSSYGTAPTFSQCYNVGVVTVTHKRYAGGIVGALGVKGTIFDAFNAGAVVCTPNSNYFNEQGYNGGIVGSTNDKTSIKNCYNIGLIESGCGISYKSESINNCYSLKNVSLKDNTTIFCSNEELMLQETFVGFDFDTVWQIGRNEQYPWPELQAVPVNNNSVNIKECSITLDKTKVQYHTKQPKVTVTYDGQTLVLNQDYLASYTVGEKTWLASTTSYACVGELGAATILIVGIGDFTGMATIDFEVTKLDMANAHLMTEWVSDGDGGRHSSSYDMKYFVYDGSEKQQSGFRVCDDYDEIDPSNYEITYKNNVKPGMATMIITGKGDYYTGVLEKEFLISLPPYTRGDLDSVPGVTLDDAIYLLYHVNFSTTYPVNQPVDFNGDGKEDLDDAIYLLYHVNFKETYPLH